MYIYISLFWSNLPDVVLQQRGDALPLLGAELAEPREALHGGGPQPPVVAPIS